MASKLELIHQSDHQPKDIMHVLSDGYSVQANKLGSAACGAPDAEVLLFAIEDANDPALAAIANRIGSRSRPDQPIVYIARDEDRGRLLASRLLAEGNFVRRSAVGDRLGTLIGDLIRRRDGERRGPRTPATPVLFDATPDHAEGLIAGAGALDAIFQLAQGEQRLDRRAIENACATVVESLQNSTLERWIVGVRQHHDATYRHCLLVTGVAVSFGLRLGLGSRDLDRLALGGLMHDLGKAQIPLAILDKPGELTEDEMAVVRWHPAFGANMLQRYPTFDSEMLAVVRSHHEYLDGSGYPDGLLAESIPDLVRVTTIADIFGALIENRPYKRGLSGPDAYDVLLGMRGQLDQTILGAMRPVAMSIESVNAAAA